MTGDEIARDALGARVLRLERSLRRTRLALAGLLAALTLLVLGAWRAQDEVRTQRLVLTGDQDSALVVLRAVPPGGEPGLILATPSGRPIMTLGGDPVRPVRR
jgi:hypothetical protein